MESSTEHLDFLNTVAKAKTFLGREFLTWPWYAADTHKEPKDMFCSSLGKSVTFDLWIDDRMVLEAVARAAASSHHSVMKGGDPSHSQEASAALAAGKIVRELKIGLNVKDVGEFSAILASDDLSPRSLKLPTSHGEPREADTLPLHLRIQHMEIFLALLDHLFQLFIAARTSPQWEEETLVDMRHWIKNRQKDEGSGTLH